jgi:rubredoxin
MKAYKYLAIPQRHQKVVSVSLNCMRLKNTNIPLVATSELDRITLGWWNTITGTWNSWERSHEKLMMSLSSMDTVTCGNWSKRIGLASINNTALLAYKRSIDFGAGAGPQTNLFLDILNLNYGTGIIAPKNNNPFIVPLGQLGFDRPGFWIHTFTQQLPIPRIFILLQAVVVIKPGIPFEPYPQVNDTHFWEAAYNSGISNLELSKYIAGDTRLYKQFGLFKLVQREESHLVLLSADLTNPNVDLNIASNWKVNDFGLGGWDLDAIVDGNILACVHRKSQYALETIVNATFLPGDTQPRHYLLSTDIFSDTDYPNLELIKIDIQSVPTETDRISLPGGADPMIQRLSPLVITTDRVTDGEIIINPPRPASRVGGFPMPAAPPSAYLIANAWTKVLFRKNIYQWERGELYKINNNAFPQNLAEMYYSEPHVTQLNYSTSPHKAFATTLETLVPTYITEYNITSKYDDVTLMRHRAEEGSLRLDWIRLYPGNPNLAIEKLPAFTILDINHGQIPSSLTPDAYAENNQFGTLIYGAEIRDTTIGGALAIERPVKHMQFYAYTDMGDRGLRVIYDDSLPDPNPVPGVVGKNGLDPANVTGPIGTTDQWFEVPLTGWTQIELPPYDVTKDLLGSSDSFLTNNKPYPGALSSGLMPLCDTILQILSTFNAPGSSDITLEFVRNTLQPLIGLTGSTTDVWQSLWAPFDAANSEKNKCSGSGCDFIYDSASGYPAGGIAPGTRFEDIPDSWVCPNCGTEKGDFDCDSKVRYLIPSLSIEIDNYKIEYHTTQNNGHLNKDFVRILNLEKHRTAFQCVENLVGQGSLELMFMIRVISGSIFIYGNLAKIVSIKGMNVTMKYSRAFTPAILMSEKRSQNVMTGTTETPSYELINQWNDTTIPPPVATTFSSILAMKPTSDATFKSVLNELNMHVDVWAVSIVALIDILIAIGLSILASPLVGIGALIALIFSEGAIVYAIESKIRDEILKGINSDNIKKSLDNLNLQRYAGEGLAENMATMALTKAGLPIDLGGQMGRNRFREQLWQIVFVTKDLFRIMLRK